MGQGQREIEKESHRLYTEHEPDVGAQCQDPQTGPELKPRV